MATVRELIDLRTKASSRAKEINARAERENRELDETETSAFDGTLAEIERLSKAIERQHLVSELDTRSTRLTGTNQPIDSNGNSPRSSASLDSQWVDSRGQRIVTLKKEQRMADLFRDSRFDSMSFGRMVRGVITGRWGDANLEQRTMSGFSAIAGGYLVPSELSSTVIDYARAASVCFSAGAVTIPMTSDVLEIARQTNDATMETKSENAAFSGSDVNFDRIMLTTRTIGTVVKASRELAEDAPNFPDLISRSISTALAYEIDRQCLVGATPGMGGLKNVGGLNTVTSVGVPSVWTPWVDAIGEIWIDNGNPNAYILCPRDAKKMAALLDTTNQPMQKPPAVAALKEFVTNSLPTNEGAGANEASSYVGDFTQMIIGVRSDVMVEISTEAGDAFDKHQVFIKTTWRGDMSVQHPAHFCRLSGITA